MRIGRQSRLAPQFVAEVQQAVVIKPSFEISARIDTWGSVALKVDKVARLISIGGMEEMLVAHFQQGGQGGVGGEVATDPGILLILAMHHGHRVPADQGFQPQFELTIPWIGHFLMLGNGIQVGGGQRPRGGDAGLARAMP